MNKRRQEVLFCLAIWLLILIIGCVIYYIKLYYSWKAPRFVKEWEIKEIKPGLRHEILSMTANKNGLYVLVKAIDSKPKAYKGKRKASEMTEDEKEHFFTKYVDGIIVYSITCRASEKDKEELIQFILDHYIPPTNAYDMKEEEKKEIINFEMEFRKKYATKEEFELFNNLIQKESAENIINERMEIISSELKYGFNRYKIQRYDFDGNLIKEWPEENRIYLNDAIRNKLPEILVGLHWDIEEIDSRDFLINPLLITSDENGNIYVADYDGNKIVKYDYEGNALAEWMIKEIDTSYDDLREHHRLFASKDKLYLISSKALYLPTLSEYDLNGNLIKEKQIHFYKIPFINKLGWLVGNEEIDLLSGLLEFAIALKYVTSIIVPSDNYIYLFSADHKILVFDEEGDKKREITTVLRTGFKKPKPVCK